MKDLIFENWRKFMQEAKPSFIKKPFKPSFIKKPFKPFEPEEDEDEFIDTGIELDDAPPTKKKRGKVGFTLKDKRGSSDDPCNPDMALARRDLGDHIFHPYDPNRDTEDWECNTRIEDELLGAVQDFITTNSADKIGGKIGEFIVDYFVDKTDNSLPLSRFTKDTPLYRGSKRDLDESALKILQQIDWKNGTTKKEGRETWGTYPINMPYTLRRDIASFSYDIKVGYKFSAMKSKPFRFVYETNGNLQTDGGGFFLDFSNIYGLRQNRHNKMSSGERFNTGTRRFQGEAEALLVTRNTGDKLPLTKIHINLSELKKNIMKMSPSDPLKMDFMNILSLSMTKRDKERFVRTVLADKEDLEIWMKNNFQKTIDYKDIPMLVKVIDKLSDDIERYKKHNASFSVFVGKEQMKGFLEYLNKVYSMVRYAYEQLSQGKEIPKNFYNPDLPLPPVQESKKRRVRVIKRKRVSNKI